MERQALGLRYKPSLMLIDDADTPIKWYYKLKTAYLKLSPDGTTFRPSAQGTRHAALEKLIEQAAGFFCYRASCGDSISRATARLI